jgi:hypothetical protein
MHVVKDPNASGAFLEWSRRVVRGGGYERAGEVTHRYAVRAQHRRSQLYTWDDEGNGFRVVRTVKEGE